MRTKLALSMMALLVTCAGCGVDLPSAASSVQLVAVTTGTAVVPKPISVETAKTIVAVLDRVAPVADALKSPDQLVDILIPAIKAEAAKVLPDPAKLALVEAASRPLLLWAKRYVEEHPELKANAQTAATLGKAVIAGLREGLQAAITKAGG